MLKLTIETGNDAFGGDPGAELARILRDLANRLESGVGDEADGILRDLNGNRVGSYSFKAADA